MRRLLLSALLWLAPWTAFAEDIAAGCLMPNGNLNRVQLGNCPSGGACGPKSELTHLVLGTESFLFDHELEPSPSRQDVMSIGGGLR
jgi:hypothetical protein